MAMNIQATFAQLVRYHYVTIQTDGQGWVDMNPAAPYPYVEGTQVAFTAVPAAGWEFFDWGEPFSGAGNPFTLNMTEDLLLIAIFKKVVTVNISVPTGHGTTDPLPGSYTYLSGTTITITAYPDPGYYFGGWQGDVTGTQNPLVITLTEGVALRVGFAAQEAPPTAGLNPLVPVGIGLGLVALIALVKKGRK